MSSSARPVDARPATGTGSTSGGSSAPVGRGVRTGSGGGPSTAGHAAAGLQLAIAIILAVYLGQWLDQRLGTAPWLLLLTLLLGAGGTFYSIYRKLMADLRREEEARKR